MYQRHCAVCQVWIILPPHAPSKHSRNVYTYIYTLVTFTRCSVTIFQRCECRNAAPGILLGMSAVYECIEFLEIIKSHIKSMKCTSCTPTTKCSIWTNTYVLPSCWYLLTFITKVNDGKSRTLIFGFHSSLSAPKFSKQSRTPHLCLTSQMYLHIQ